MKKLICILLFISSSFFSIFAIPDEAQAFKAFQIMNWNKAASLYYQILKTDTALSSSEQYGRAVISSALDKDSVKTFFFINKLNEHSDFSEDYVANIEQALEIEKKSGLLEPVLLYICKISKEECSIIQKHILEKYSSLGRYNDAYKLLNNLMSNYPGDNKLILTVARLETILGNTDNAIMYAGQMLVNNPEDFEGNLFLGNIYLRSSENQINSLRAEFKQKKGSLKRSDLLDYQISLNEIVKKDLSKAYYYLNKANSIRSNFYIRNNLSRITQIKDENDKMMIKLKLINAETLLP